MVDGAPGWTADNLTTPFISLNVEAESIAALGGIVVIHREIAEAMQLKSSS